MVRKLVRTTIAAIVVAALSSTALAAPPYSEGFSSGTAGWRATTSNAVPLVSVPSGGPDNSAYIRNNLSNLIGVGSNLGQLSVFRAQTNYAGINLDYTGDWMAAGVQEVTAWVRHNAPESLVFYGRFSPATSFPAAFYNYTPAVAPNVWTQLTFDVSPSSPQLVSYETGTYQGIYQNFDNSGIGNMLFGVNIPANLRNTGPYVFEFDNVSVITPEPASIALAAIGLVGLGSVARRRKSR